jgi:hypothetical protein
MRLIVVIELMPLYFRYRRELHSHGIKNLRTTELPDVDLKLPKLKGNNIQEHFHNIALSQIEPYQKLVKQLLNSQIPKLPEVSKIFISSYIHFNPPPLFSFKEMGFSSRLDAV